MQEIDEEYEKEQSQFFETHFHPEMLITGFKSAKDKPLYELFSQTYNINKKKLNYYSPIPEELSPGRSNKIKRKIENLNREIHSLDFKRSRMGSLGNIHEFNNKITFMPNKVEEKFNYKFRENSEKENFSDEDDDCLDCVNIHTPIPKYKQFSAITPSSKFNITLLDNIRTDDFNFVENSKSKLIHTESLVDSPNKPIDKHKKKIEELKKEFSKDIRRSSNKPVINLNLATMNLETERYLTITSNRLSSKYSGSQGNLGNYN
jgi:hypothetical protein